MHAVSGPWDLVLISGDLTWTGASREFGMLDSTLRSLWNYLRDLGSAPRLLVVPGTHDFWRDEPSWEMRPDVRYRVSEIRKAFRGTGPSELTQRIRGAFGPFNSWFNAWRLAHPSPMGQTFRNGLLPGDFAETIEKKGLKVGVIGLNTIFRNSASTRSGDLYELDLEQVETATGKSARKWVLQHDAVLLLTHHPPSMLRRKHLDQIQAVLTPSSGLLLHLCGKQLSDVHGPSLHLSQAPSLFGSAAAASEMSQGRWGYTVGELDVTGTGGQLRLLPRSALATKHTIVLGPDERWVSGANEAVQWDLAGLRRKPGSDAPMGRRAPDPELSPLTAMLGPSSPPTRPEKLWVVRDVLETPSLPPGVKLKHTLETGRSRVGWLAWAPSGDALGIGHVYGHLTYWKPGEAKPRWTVRAHMERLADLCFSPDGSALASRSAHEVRLWDVVGERIETSRPLLSGGNVTALSPTGILVADGNVIGGTLQFWDTRNWGPSDLVLTSIPTLICLAWSPDGQVLACGGAGDEALSFLKVRTDGPTSSLDVESLPFPGHHVDVLGIAWMPGTTRIAAACRDRNIYVMDTQADSPTTVLEGHTDAVVSVSFSSDGRLLASMSLDGIVRLFRTDTWEPVAQFGEPAPRQAISRLAFSPTEPVLACPGPGGQGVRLWEIDIDTLLRSQTPSTTVHQVSAKVVLVGEGRAGKSCLALRMGQDRYEEMESTHGMRFWSMPVEQPASEATGTQTERELILWDMGGQSEYQLVHQLFLRDSTLALMVMEPGRGERALEEIEGWNQRLLAQAGGRNIRKLLVGAKVDSSASAENRPAIEQLVRKLQFAAYVSTSAKTGQGIAELKTALNQTIDWSTIEQVSRPELFQRLRQHIQRLRETKRVVLTFSELENELRAETGSDFDPEALRAVVGHLTRQGLVADTRMADGTRMLILEIEQVERYAGSLIVAARDNPHGVPAIDMAKVMSPTMRFPRIKPEERLRRDQELAVLDCVIELLLEHGLCLRHEGLLIFPSLFQPTQAASGADFSHAISLHYDFSGPIDNIYASLITSLAISQRFGTMRLWEDRAEFGHAGGDTSGVRRVQSRGQGARGYAQLDVYFDSGTPTATRDLFVNFVEEHLRERGVELLERLTITCACGVVFAEEVVRKRLAAGLPDIICSSCEVRTPLTLGAQQSRERNPELVKQVQGLRTIIQEQRHQSVTETKVSMTEAKEAEPGQGEPIRILHLSDLHVGAGDDPISLLQPLVADLKDKRDGLGVERLDYLVISGDITNRATPAEFEKAREFVSRLIEKFGLTAERCIIVPGNHDLDWETEVYTWKKKRQVDERALEPGTFHKEGEVYAIRNEKYPERFKNFSKYFYHPLTQKAYPLAPEEQCIPFLFSETRLQFLAMNSAWEIDEYFKDRSSIFEQALARGLSNADQEILAARKRGELAEDAKVLRLSVWHHPITGNEKIQKDAFVGQLLKADLRVCLHGHVHEDRADLVNYLHAERRLHVVGAGSFGAPTHERPEAVPRLYNLMEVQRDLRSIRVNTRCLRKREGAWEGWAVWRGEKRDERRTYYDVPLT